MLLIHQIKKGDKHMNKITLTTKQISKIKTLLKGSIQNDEAYINSTKQDDPCRNIFERDLKDSQELYEYLSKF
jgi:hypothetical protein